MTATEHMPSEDRLRELLVGKQVLSVAVSDEPPGSYEDGPTGRLTLDDGTVLKVWGNDGGCACSAGCYPLAMLHKAEGTITNVRVDENRDEEYGDEPCRTCGKKSCWEHDGWYRIFVVTEAAETMVASFEGSDGNGFYGTGWWLEVEA